MFGAVGAAEERDLLLGEVRLEERLVLLAAKPIVRRPELQVVRDVSVMERGAGGGTAALGDSPLSGASDCSSALRFRRRDTLRSEAVPSCGYQDKERSEEHTSELQSQ